MIESHFLLIGLIELSSAFFILLIVGIISISAIVTALVVSLINNRKLKSTALNTYKSYLSLIENFNGMAYRCLNDEFWTMKFVSKKTFELIGYNESEIIDNKVISFEEVIDAQYRGHLREKWQKVLSQHEDFSDEYIIITKTGEKKWVHETGHGVFDITGKVVYIEGFIHDVTESRNLSFAEIRNQEKYKNLIENSQDAIIIEDNRLITYVNPAAMKLFRAKSKDDLIGKNVNELVTDRFKNFLSDRVKRVETSHLPNQVAEYNLLRLDGTIAHVELSSAPYLEKDKLLIFVFIHDITEKVEALEKVKDQAATLEMIIYGTSAGTWEYNVQTESIIVNERWCEMIGYTLLELHPSTLEEWINLVHPDDVSVAKNALTAHFENQTPDYSVEIRMRHKDGHYIWIYDKGKVSKWDESGKPLMMFGTHQDITEKKEKELELEYVSNHDFLTGIWNRRAFENHIVKMDDSALLPIGIIMGDVNGLKAVNDQYGHEKGDQLLIAVSQTLEENHPQDFVCRVGGDEFVIITPNSSVEQQEKAIESLLRKLGKIHSFEFNVSVSFGFGMKTTPDESIYASLRKAEIKMYESKKKSRE